MHAPAITPAAADRPADRYVVRPGGVLAEILGAADMGEDELLLRLLELGLITYPSPLLGELLEKLPEVLEAEVMARLGPTDVVLFGQANRACRAAVVAFGMPQESQEEGRTSDESTEGGPLLLRVEDFVGSVERLAWAKARGCPWDEFTCSTAAKGGHLEVLKWAWERRCPWDWRTTASVGWTPGGAAVGAGARVPLGPGYVHVRRVWWTSACGEVGARAWVPVERKNDTESCGRRAPARVAVGAGARLPVGFVDVCTRRSGRAPGGVAVGAGTPLPMERGVGQVCC
jgi:hypothetical protein